MVLVGNYTGHLKLCQAFFKLRMQRNVEILDVSSHLANPGLVGRELNQNGYTCVDGLEGGAKNLAAIKAEKIYRNCIFGRVSELGSIPVNDGENNLLKRLSQIAQILNEWHFLQRAMTSS